MAKSKVTITPDKLAESVQKVLNEYGEQVQKDIHEVTLKVADQGVKQIKANAKQYKWGSKYVNGWGKTDASTRVTTDVVIHHKTTPGLPHLLEFGHLHVANGKRTGITTKAFPHIAKVNDEIIELYQKEVKAKL